MLLPAQFRQFADAGHQLLLGFDETGVESLAFRGQNLFFMGCLHQGVQLLVQPVVPVIARPVPGVTTDIERFVSARRRRDGFGLESVGIVGAIGLARIGFQLFEGGDVLCQGHQRSQGEQDGGKDSFHGDGISGFGGRWWLPAYRRPGRSGWLHRIHACSGGGPVPGR